MHHVDSRPEMTVGGYVLVVGGGSDVVAEAEAVVFILEMHVDQALVRAVEGDALVGHGCHRVVIGHVGRQNHDAGVEEVGPSDIWSGGEGMGNVEELIGSAIGDDIGVDVDDLGEL